MQIVKKEENKESIYEIEFDKEVLRKLISEIITSCSFRRQERCFIEARDLDEAKQKIASKKDFNGNTLYKDVTDIKEEPINDSFDYWRHGDPKPYSFQTNLLVRPQLVDFLINLLKGEVEEIDYEWFAEKKELTEKQRVQEEINNLDKEINSISNFKTARKIEKLQQLAAKVNYLNSIPDFDKEKLEYFYSLAEQCIELFLIQQTIQYQRKQKI